ncbi:MAG TPA: cation-transporting P-type ATPase [Burkholderiales bacterium]|nr:cation-transporting P-type ATPase [Burkholderiales bacterium]
MNTNGSFISHATAVAEVMRCLGVDAEGLSSTEVEARLRQYGRNRLPDAQHKGPLLRFAQQFDNVLIYALLVAAIITGVLGHWVDTSVIVGVVVINAIVGFIQEGKAESALAAIQSMLAPLASVKREGQRVRINAEMLVLGDLVLLESGDRVPADLRLIELRNLQIDESALTGESVPVAKTPENVAPTAEIGDRKCLAYCGTVVTYGQGLGVVIATGEQTEIGRIGRMLREVEELSTPLLRKIAVFGRWLAVATFVVALLTVLFGHFLRGHSWEEMFLVAVGLAVAAIPEGLPALMTITLAIGVQRMAKRNTIVRRLPAVESLGSVTVICTDKTGTLTKNEMTVQRVITTEGVYEVGGSGYAPHGDFSYEGEPVTPLETPLLFDVARAGLLCNDAVLRKSGDHWELQGDPTEGALLTLSHKVGVDPHRHGTERTDSIPFESQNRYMATLHRDESHHFIVVKGAPETILSMSDTQRGPEGDETLDHAYWTAHIEACGAMGMRVLAVALKPVERLKALHSDHMQGGYVLLGLYGIIDPPREEAIASVARCRAAGIRIKMITGDHALTARNIGLQLGIGDGCMALTGAELEALDDDALRQAVRDVDVFARASPEHKLRLVKALQANGEIVAMTGDGVNDAPALKRADVGVAMGRKGTDAARQASEIVLTDDNFKSITAAVEEGRTTFDNITKAILFTLPTNGGEAGVLIAALLGGMVMPITAVQILWVNMVTEITLGLSLAVEPAERDVMSRQPRDPRAPILSALLSWRVLFVSLLLIAGTLGLFMWEMTQHGDVAMSRTVAVNALVMGEIFYLWNSRYTYDSVLNRRGLFGNRFVLYAIGTLLVFQALFTYAPFMQKLFGTADIDAAQWLRIVGFGVALMLLVEIEKALLRHRHAHRGHKAKV